MTARLMVIIATVFLAGGVAGGEVAQPAAPSAARPRADLTRMPTAEEIVPEIVATVNGKPVTRDQLAGLTIGLYGRETLMTLISQEVVRQEAERQGITVTVEEIEEYARKRVTQQLEEEARRMGAKSAAELTARAGESAEQLEILRKGFEDGIRPFIGPELLARKLMLKSVQVTDADVRAEFERRHGPKVKVQQIVVNTREQAQEIVKRLGQGADFAQLARDISIDTATRSKGGEMPPMSRGSPLADAAFALKAGQTAGPVQTEYGFHVIRLMESIPAAQVKLEDVKDSLREEVTEMTLFQQRQKWIDELMLKADIKRTM